MKRDLFEAQNLLSTSGIAVIAFGVWSILKAIIVLILSKGTFNGQETEGIDPAILSAFSWVILLVVAVIDLSIRFFVGLSARAEGRGKKKSVVYLVFTVILILGSLYNLYALATQYIQIDLIDGVVSLLVELTSLFALLELFINAIKVKRLSKLSIQERS